MSLMKYYHSVAIHGICEIITSICQKFQTNTQLHYIPSFDFVMKLAQAVGLLMDLDTIKNMKGVINNDLSIMKR